MWRNVAFIAAASMTAFQDTQATEWRDVAIGEIPEVVVYRDPRGTFTRSVTITFGVAVVIMLLVRGRTSFFPLFPPWRHCIIENIRTVPSLGGFKSIISGLNPAEEKIISPGN